MNRKAAPILIGSLLAGLLLSAGPAPNLPASRNAQQERLEYSFLVEVDQLEKNGQEWNKLKARIEELQGKIASLRRQAGPNPNVIDEMRIKSDLNELQGQLQTDAALQKQQDEKKRVIEQEGTNLVSLYNDRIETLLSTPDNLPGSPTLVNKIETLNLIARKRRRVQDLLARFQSQGPGVSLQTFLSSTPPKATDKESLQLTLDLFHDHQAALVEQLKKWTSEQEEIKNELKLQGKMREFMEDFQGMSDLPQTRMRDEELRGLVGKNQKSKLESRLAEVQSNIALGQKTLSQITQMMGQIQIQLEKTGGVMKR